MILRKIFKTEPLRYSLITLIFIFIMTLGITLIFLFFFKDESVKVKGFIKPKNFQPIISEISGYIAGIPVNDGERIETDQVLLILKKDNLIFLINEIELQLEKKQQEKKYRQKEYMFYKKKMALELDIIEKKYKSDEQLYKIKALTDEEIEKSRYDYYTKLIEKDEIMEKMNYALQVVENEIAMLEIDLKRQMNNLEKMVIKSNYYGIIIIPQNKDSLLYCEAGKPIFYIYDETNFIIEAQIPEIYISKIAINQNVEIQIKAFPYEEFKIFKGTLYHLASEVRNGYITGKIHFNDPLIDIQNFSTQQRIKLFYGLMVEVKITIEKLGILKKIFN